MKKTRTWKRTLPFITNATPIVEYGDYTPKFGSIEGCLLFIDHEQIVTWHLSDAVVVECGESDSDLLGNYIIIKHKGLFHIFGKLNKSTVTKNKILKAGTTLGTVGDNHKQTYTYLFYQVRTHKHGGKTLDPQRFIQ